MSRNLPSHSNDQSRSCPKLFTTLLNTRPSYYKMTLCIFMAVGGTGLYLLGRHLTQHFFSRESQNKRLVLVDSAAWIQMFDTPSYKQAPLQCPEKLNKNVHYLLVY